MWRSFACLAGGATASYAAHSWRSASCDEGARRPTRRITVTYQGRLYDVTDFADAHPGGASLINAAAGQDLSHFFEYYTIHLGNERVRDLLAGMEVEGEAAATGCTPAGSPGAPRSDAVVLAGNSSTWLARHLRVVGVVVCLPFFLAYLVIRRATAACWLLGGGCQRQRIDGGEEGRPRRVAVIGGGIAGCGAAYALSASEGCDVVVYEARSALGGNASTFEWALPSGGSARTGLAVLAWPLRYFRNYTELLGRLGVATEEVTLPYYINSTVEGCEGTFDQLGADENAGTSRDLRLRFADDLRRWDAAVASVRWWNALTCGSRDSMYKSSYLNPMNYVSLKTLATKGFGCSDAFWDVVVVSQHGATFLTPQLSSVPATILPLIDDLIPLSRVPGGKDFTMRSWTRDSREVFAKMTAACRVKTGSRVLSATPATTAAGGHVHTVVDDAGGIEEVDAVVFACNASAAANILQGKSWVESALLGGVSYTDDTDLSWVKAIVHQDASVLRPSAHSDQVRSKYATYVEVSDGRDSVSPHHYEQTFVLGSWYPTVKHADATMLVTHGLAEEAGKQIDPALVRGRVSHVRAHPELTPMNLLVSQLLFLVQGRRNVFYASSYATPGNGHDLSLLSGFVAARLAGAPYPFPENAEAHADFKQLMSLMIGSWGAL